MNDITTDFDAKNANAHGSTLGELTESTYRGFLIDGGIAVKVWYHDEFIGKYATVKLAKHAIDSILASA